MSSVKKEPPRFHIGDWVKFDYGPKKVSARIVEDRGQLVGALMVHPEDEVFAITSAGGVIRTSAAEIKQSGRQTMGVRLVNLAPGQSLVAIARNEEITEPEDALADDLADDELTAEDAPADGTTDEPVSGHNDSEGAGADGDDQ